MSKGPKTARINKIGAAENFHLLWVSSCFNGKVDVVMLPQSVDISALKRGDIITYYLAEETCDERLSGQSQKERAVLVFKRLPDEQGVDGSFFWVSAGEKTLYFQKIPCIVEILLRLSAYYGKREKLVVTSLKILEMTQDVEALDALFSMRPEVLDPLLGMKNSVIPVQIADSLVSLSLSGADLEQPRRRDLRQMLSLAILHGEPPRKIYDFISNYKP